MDKKYGIAPDMLKERRREYESTIGYILEKIDEAQLEYLRSLNSQQQLLNRFAKSQNESKKLMLKNVTTEKIKQLGKAIIDGRRTQIKAIEAEQKNAHELSNILSVMIKETERYWEEIKIRRKKYTG